MKDRCHKQEGEACECRQTQLPNENNIELYKRSLEELLPGAKCPSGRRTAAAGMKAIQSVSARIHRVDQEFSSTGCGVQSNVGFTILFHSCGWRYRFRRVTAPCLRKASSRRTRYDKKEQKKKLRTLAKGGKGAVKKGSRKLYTALWRRRRVHRRGNASKKLNEKSYSGR